MFLCRMACEKNWNTNIFSLELVGFHEFSKFLSRIFEVLILFDNTVSSQKDFTCSRVKLLRLPGSQIPLTIIVLREYIHAFLIIAWKNMLRTRFIYLSVDFNHLSLETS